MSAGELGWRIIITDSESPSGVAPACPQTATNHLLEDNEGAPLPGVDESGVYDCCPGPHIDCWLPRNALRVVRLLNEIEAEVCS